MFSQGLSLKQGLYLPQWIPECVRSGEKEMPLSYIQSYEIDFRIVEGPRHEFAWSLWLARGSALRSWDGWPG
ncbi:hypothetical protein CGMCC3_g17785 [Colletotrichum fructicola]|uniref:Uncharacterized protein n=1 Tax=Colletotrichum fructicola (strain Nara gc5) TaxID=1213859 RepID=A0A7J6ILD1_COLFN|nr:uncharacterized protein CGMCC3_g17785 [Colletotrichum fructicola]KAE9566035.1 hypothetical protein CGMCC3_g17785 [Colletotrichum fructicola]KAF4477589.1 hypothetical protein CGGC5_v013101 [Colletotrichum fructicola Nara gc5]